MVCGHAGMFPEPKVEAIYGTTLLIKRDKELFLAGQESHGPVLSLEPSRDPPCKGALLLKDRQPSCTSLSLGTGNPSNSIIRSAFVVGQGPGLSL